MPKAAWTPHPGRWQDAYVIWPRKLVAKQVALVRILRREAHRWSAVLCTDRQPEATLRRQRERSELRKVILQALGREVDSWAALTYDELREELAGAVYRQGELHGVRYYSQIELLEDKPEHVLVAVAVDDGNRWATKPFGRTFLVYADGRVDK